MKVAIVTGTSRGIGLALAKRLVSEDYRVYGISRSEPVEPISGNFIHVKMDLLETSQLTQFCNEMTKNEKQMNLLINNAGIGTFAPHEELQPDRLQRMIRLNFEVPILLTRLLLRPIKKTQGQILNISSVTAKKESPFGCAYGATKAGLSHFSGSLFEEVRKSGVRILTLHPDLTKTAFYDNLSFTCSESPDTHLLPEQVADAAMFMLNSPRSINIQDITLRPQKNQIIKKAKNPG